MPKSISTNESAFKKFLNENKSLAIMLPLLIVLIIVVIIMYSGLLSNDSKPASLPLPSIPAGNSQAASEGNAQVEVLPQIVRNPDESDKVVEPVKDPFETPMRLTGILNNSEGNSYAIIECGGISYIVETNGYIGDSTWKVIQIEATTVTIESNQKSVELKIADMPKNEAAASTVEN